MINIDLAGKSILLTGALGAIAESVVRKLTAAGAHLILVDIKPEHSAKQTLGEWKISPSSYVYFSIDITDDSLLWTPFLVMPEVVVFTLSQPLRKPSTIASSASTISHR